MLSDAGDLALGGRDYAGVIGHVWSICGSKNVSPGLWMIFLCLTVAALVLALLSLQGFHEVDEGVRGTACFSAQLVQAPAVRSAVWVPFLVSSESTVFDLVRYSQLWSIVKVPENEPVGSSGPSFWTAFTLGGCASIKPHPNGCVQPPFHSLHGSGPGRSFYYQVLIMNVVQLKQGDIPGFSCKPRLGLKSLFRRCSFAVLGSTQGSPDTAPSRHHWESGPDMAMPVRTPSRATRI